MQNQSGFIWESGDWAEGGFKGGYKNKKTHNVQNHAEDQIWFIQVGKNTELSHAIDLEEIS